MALSVQRRKVWLTPTTRVQCSNAAKTRNPLKLVGVSQTPEPISAVSGPKFAILWGSTAAAEAEYKYIWRDHHTNAAVRLRIQF